MEEEFDIDGIVSEQLKNKWWAKRKLRKLLKKQIIIADNSIKQSAHVLKAIIEEKNDLLKKREKESNPVVLETYNSLYSVQCDMERLFNFIGFIAINSIDIFILNRQFLKDSDIRSRHFYARYACMLMYEMTEDVTQLLGNDKDVVTGKLFGDYLRHN